MKYILKICSELLCGFVGGFATFIVIIIVVIVFDYYFFFLDFFLSHPIWFCSFAFVFFFVVVNFLTGFSHVTKTQIQINSKTKTILKYFEQKKKYFL